MLNRFFARLPLERYLILASVALALVHTWVGRHAMNPDGMSYLDVGDSFFRRDWGNAVNAWWSPLYPWVVGLVLGVVKPPPSWEFPLVHLVNFAVFLIALMTFRFLLHALMAFRRDKTLDTEPNGGEAFPEWALVLLAYPIFLWIALEVETVYDVSPDLAVLACVCLAAGMLLSLRPDDQLWKFALFGLVLGIGYWTKTILFPLGIVSLTAGYWWRRTSPGWGRGMAIAAMVFLGISTPLIFFLSHQKGRFTFGDSGQMNYAWHVSPRTFWRNWQGEVPGSGTPVHPSRQLLQHPPVFEFDGPVVGTYPPWTDPSYWNEGLQWHFRLKPQMEVLAGTVPSEVRLLLLTRPALVTGVLVLALLSGHPWLAGLRKAWPLIAISLVGMALYLPLVENDRYLGGFVVVLFLILISTTSLRPEDQKTGAYVAFAVFLMMAAGTADYSIRIVTNHLAIPGNGPNSTRQDVVAAEQLWRMGARPGDKVAVIADGTGAYWARLAKVRIVAEIMDANHNSREFWNAPEELQKKVYGIFAGANATLVVTSCPICPPGVPTGWERLEGTLYCVRSLQPSP